MIVARNPSDRFMLRCLCLIHDEFRFAFPTLLQTFHINVKMGMEHPWSVTKDLASLDFFFINTNGAHDNGR